MICVECTNPDIDRLFSEFKSKYIQLTICPKCGNLADKYIEFDNVIVFLDMILLKPQAYRHLAYNVVEETIFGDNKGDSKTNQGSFSFGQYKKLIRYCVLAILFEVYLIWAYEEKSDHHTKLMDLVLQSSAPLQYAFFVIQQLVDRATFCLLINLLYRKVLGWPKTESTSLKSSIRSSYYSCVLLVTTCMSLAVKCVPIIMLIWPYENAMLASAAVDILGVFNTIEALRIITGSSFVATTAIVLLSSLFLILNKHMIMTYIVACSTSGETFVSLLNNEVDMRIYEMKSLVDFVHFSFIRVLGYSS